MKTILIISGLDPSGGAGFMADIAVALRIGLYPLGAITNNTVQNSLKFYKSYQVSFDILKDQVETICEEFRPDAVKIGMLGETKMVDAVVDLIIDHNFPNVVLDPLLKSSKGSDLNSPKAFKVIKERLFPRVFAITPNIPEAEKISGKIIIDPQSMQRAARFISEEFDIPVVVIKGGHLEGDPVDVLYYLGKFVQLREKRLKGDFHGTGCVFSSAMASFLAEGNTPETAFKKAHKFQHLYLGRRIDNHWNFFVRPNHSPF